MLNFLCILPMQVMQIPPPWVWQEPSSSWVWSSAWRPWHILLIAFAVICIAEILTLRFLGGITKWSRLLPAVLGANAVCFLLATIIRWIDYLPLYSMSLDALGAAFEEGPFYTFNVVFVVAVVIKLLLLQILFRKETQRRVCRAVVLTAANAIVVVLVACIERLLCTGHSV